MSYLGSVPSSGTPFSNNKIQVLSGNGSNTQFTLDYRVNNKADIEVIVNNVQQNPFDGSYDVSNNNILTFSGAPSSGSNNIHIYFRGYSHNVSVPEANSINSNQLTITGVTAGTYGNTTAIPVVTIDAAGRITSATTNSVSGVTGVSWTTANNTLTVSTSTVAYSANVSEFSNPVTVSNTLTTKAIVPDANVTHDIGTTLMRYKDLYLANSTIYIGTSTVSETAGALQISSGGNPAVNLATITQATNLAGNAYSNAVAYSANATNISSGTVAFARLPAQYIGTTAVQSTSAAQAVSGITTLAAGNTTITGFANVTSTIQGGSSLTIAGALSGVTTAAVGNTTITGFANVTSTLQVGGAVTFSNTLSVAGNVTGTAANVTIVAGLFTTTFANTGVTSLPGNTTIAGDLVVSGNLTTSGTTTYVNTTNLNIGDNIITLNADLGASAPSENAGIEVNRGSSANVALRWNETSDIWQTTTDGTTYLTVATNNDVTTAYTNATLYAANASNISSGTLAFARLPSAYIGTTAIQSSSASQALSGITTIAVGNTTITGFANVSSTIIGSDQIRQVTANTTGLSGFELTDAVSGGNHIGSITRLANGIKINSFDFISFAANAGVTGISANNEYVRITSAGKVGIGTSAPNELLTVYKNDTTNAGIATTAAISLYNPQTVSSGYGSAIKFYGDTRGNNNIAGIGALLTSGTAAGATGYLTFYTKETEAAALPTERMRITYDGKIGIGTTTPATIFDVYGSLNADVYQRIQNANTGTSAAAQYYAKSGTYQTQFFHTGDNWTNSTGIFAVASAGGVYNNGPGGLAIGTVHGSGTVRFSAGGTTESMRIAANGNVGIANTAPADKLRVEGSFSAITKSFLISHPTKEGKTLRYSSLEGPENGVYVRGSANTLVIELPEYWINLVHEDSITVNLTAKGKSQTLYVEDIKDNKVFIGTTASNKSPNYFYTVYAERKDVNKLVVEE